jgi:hypothetical protein
MRSPSASELNMRVVSSSEWGGIAGRASSERAESLPRMSLRRTAPLSPSSSDEVKDGIGATRFRVTWPQDVSIRSPSDILPAMSSLSESTVSSEDATGTAVVGAGAGAGAAETET